MLSTTAMHEYEAPPLPPSTSLFSLPPLSRKPQPTPGNDCPQMAVLEAQIRASISNANSMFAAAPAPPPAAVTADDGPMNGSSVPKKAQDHTLR